MSTINLNNLDDRKAEMTKLGASEVAIQQMEEKMRLGSPSFEVRETKPAIKGHVDIIYPFKQAGSTQSPNYYFTKFRAEFHKVKPLEEGQSYFLITPKGDGKNEVKKMDHPIEAIEQFKKRDGNCELAVGKDVVHKTILASMEAGTINFVSRDFRNAFYGKPTEQTFFCEEGKGFTAPQASNLVQGRSVYRDDLVAFNGGEVYKAWVNLDTEKGKTGLNFPLKTYRDPAYGFDLSKVLDDYNIKGLEKIEIKEALETSLKNGDRPVVTLTKDGADQKLHIETAVRFGKVNFFKADGTPEKREQFLKKTTLTNELSKDKNKGKQKEMAEGQGLSR